MTTETDTLRARLDEHRIRPAHLMMSADFLEAACRPLLDLVDQLARMRTDGETPGGMSGDVAVDLLGGMIEEARRFSIDRPATLADSSPVETIPGFEPLDTGPPPSELISGAPLSFGGLTIRVDSTVPDGLLVARMPGGGHVACLVGSDPVLSLQAELPETTWGFYAGPRVSPDCRTCNGTGEIVEFPAEADERMVACTACGGTGEALVGSMSRDAIDGVLP